MKTYCIKQNYVHRDHVVYFDDTTNKDEWQREVYEYAHDVLTNYGLRSVADFGTGSGFKFVKHFEEFDHIGIDLPCTVKWLQQTYPNDAWSSDPQDMKNRDMIIASDVIEHLGDPDWLLDIIAEASPKFVVFSTPDRDLLPDAHSMGPPPNPTHVREWNTEEFSKYIGSRFKIRDHFISNSQQATQLLLATL